jgi:PAS domain S-box-containing protein
VVTDARAPDNPIIAVNSAFERLTGYAASDVVGRNCRLLAGPETEQEGSSMLREAVMGARPALVELLNYKKDGTPFRNAVMIAPFFDAEERLRYFVGSQMEVPPPAARAGSRRRAAADLVGQLTPRQRQVLREMTLGYRNKQIAARLGLSEKTVKMHRSALLERLEAMSSTDAVRIAVEAELALNDPE